jgi:hypothetical protein
MDMVFLLLARWRRVKRMRPHFPALFPKALGIAAGGVRGLRAFEPALNFRADIDKGLGCDAKNRGLALAAGLAGNAGHDLAPIVFFAQRCGPEDRGEQARTRRPDKRERQIHFAPGFKHAISDKAGIAERLVGADIVVSAGFVAAAHAGPTRHQVLQITHGAELFLGEPIADMEPPPDVGLVVACRDRGLHAAAMIDLNHDTLGLKLGLAGVAHFNAIDLSDGHVDAISAKLCAL